jgi:peptidoglycan/LPS O-acetylase OafA/YrhL
MVRDRLGYVPALDGLRGIAIALVLLCHVGWLPGGFLGVDVFFVLSGFLITTLLLEEWSEARSISLRAFYIRRARRLLPALLTLLAILTALVAAYVATGTPAAVEESFASIAASLFYFANIVRATGHPLIGPLTPMWSLAQEEQFYLFWPPLLLLLLQRGVRLRSLGIGLAVTASAVMVWRAHLGPSGRTFFAPDTHADPLLIGCLLATLRRGGRLGSIPWPVVAIACGALAVDVAAASPTGSLVYLFGFSVAGLSTAAIIAAAVDQHGPLPRMLTWTPLVNLGVISYGLYVWQGLVLTVFSSLPGGRPTAIVPTVVVALLSYRYIEQPFRRRRRGRTPLPILEPI